MSTTLRTVALAVSTWLALAPAAHAEVQLSIRNGRVTIVAKDATVRQILAEWARVGKTKIVNGERVPGGPVTLELNDVSEAEALDVLLRTLSGYLAAPRAALVADASLYDSIVVMPTVAAAAPRVSAPSGAPPPFAAPPAAFNQNNNNDDDQDGQQPVRPGGVQPVRPPIFSTFPTPQQGNPNTNVARPMLPVVRPGQVGAPQQPPQQAPQNNPAQVERNDVPLNPPPVAPAVPSAAPGGFAGTSAPGMMPPAAAAQPGQTQTQPQR